jgi:hypothetical protein
MPTCRDCWTQEASGRPTFADIVARLAALLGMPARLESAAIE